MPVSNSCFLHPALSVFFVESLFAHTTHKGVAKNFVKNDRKKCKEKWFAEHKDPMSPRSNGLFKHDSFPTAKPPPQN